MANPLDTMRKLHSRLRCVANGKSDVNAVRAQRNGAVRVTSAVKQAAAPELAAVTRQESLKDDLGTIRRIKRGTKQKKLSTDVELNVFVLFNRDSANVPAFVKRRSGRIGSATITPAQFADLEKNKSVQTVELGETLRAPDAQVGVAVPPVPPANRHAHLNNGRIAVRGGSPVSLDRIGENILIGIIDVGGIDFAHEDFMDDEGNSRILRIWDQGGDAFDPPEADGYRRQGGQVDRLRSEITAKHIAFALKEARAAGASPYDLAPQSQQIRGSHATHVASIAAGRSGLCKRAKIAAVLISLPDSDNDRRKSFYDTTRIVDGIAYLFALAESERCDAVSINISLGTNGGRARRLRV